MFVVVSFDREAFGINLNLLPTTACEVLDAKSPANVGIVAVEELILLVSVTTNVPTFLFDNIAVKPYN